MNAPAELSADLRAQRQREVVQALMAVLPTHCLLHRDEDTAAYECDALSAYRRLPLAVALPETESQVQRIVQICRRMNVPIVPRGAGTSLSGGALPIGHGVVLSLARFTRIVEVDSCAHGHRSARRAQSRDLRGRRAVRPLLRARSLVADRVHDRRQRVGELGRRSLPEIRAHMP